jgi:transposase
VLYAYSRGITKSRQIARCCEENIIFMALSAGTRPHFTTIADFISSVDQEIVNLFLQVLLYCDAMGLIGKEMFAVDGCKMPSNASKEWSGTKEELQGKKDKMEKVIKQILKRHKEMDETEKDKEIIGQEEKSLETLKKKVKKIKEWLKDNDDKLGKTGNTPIAADSQQKDPADVD